MLRLVRVQSKSAPATAVARFTASQAAEAEGREWVPPVESPRLDSRPAAKKFVRSLGNAQQRHLLSALHECAVSAQSSPTAEATADSLFRGADRRYPRGLLDRNEFLQALRAHKLREEQARAIRDRLPVPTSRLFSLAVATGIPFVGFGFLDNFIMIAAGESIEHRFGVTLGISMMAAAAIGNLVSDVAGVCLAESIENSARKIFGYHAPQLSRYQQTTRSVRVARALGGVVGVSVGCVLGMMPLLWFDDSKGICPSSSAVNDLEP